MNFSQWIIKADLAQIPIDNSPQFLQQRITKAQQPPACIKTLIAFLVDGLSQEEIVVYESGDWKDEIGIEIKKEIIRRKTG
jgi:hypothetical protein